MLKMLKILKDERRCYAVMLENAEMLIDAAACYAGTDGSSEWESEYADLVDHIARSLNRSC